MSKKWIATLIFAVALVAGFFGIGFGEEADNALMVIGGIGLVVLAFIYLRKALQAQKDERE